MLGLTRGRGKAQSETHERIQERAERLAKLRNHVNTTLARWISVMEGVVPKDLELDATIGTVDGSGSRGILTWSRNGGISIGWRLRSGVPPKTYEEKRDVIDLLPALEAEIEAELDRLLKNEEAEGRLSLVDPNGGELSESTGGGELSEEPSNASK